jgi:4-alpha-glucanotransferase
MAPARSAAALVSPPRLAGISVPLSALRSESDWGIGDFEDLTVLVDWAAHCGQRIIALLPLGESGPGESSPYNALSSFALDPIYLRPPAIEEIGSDRDAPSSLSRAAVVDHARARACKEPLFEEAFRRFQARGADDPRRARFGRFRRGSASWLADYSIFRALLDEHGGHSWKDWPEPLRRREPRALEKARVRLRESISFFEFLQFAAEEAWLSVRRAAAERGVLFMGDLPFAPSENSADVWANPEIFDLSRSVGAPPDSFSETGQRWGLPMYRWESMRAGGWRWLRARARRMAELYDLLRIDHVVGLFRAFNFVGEKPNGFDPPEEEAEIAQGREILDILAHEAGPAKLVAEDLGLIPPFVTAMLSELGIPGYKVLRWQRDDECFEDPERYPECSVATTGTHDTETLAVWWDDLPPIDRRSLVHLVDAPPQPDPAPGTLSRPLRHAILGRLYRSRSRYVILPIQDLFGWRERINTPATITADNWVFRLPQPLERFATDPEIAADTRVLRGLIDASGRLRKIDESTPREPRGRGSRVKTDNSPEGAMNEFKAASVRAGGLTFHYLEAGAGPLVLCLHGFPDHARSFRFQLPALAKAGFRAVAPYLRGYAPSDVPANGPYQGAALAKDVAALIDALSPKEPAFVFGHDWGALATYGAAQIAPHRIRKIATAAVPHGPRLLQAIVTNYSQMKRSWYIFMFQMPTAEAAVSNKGFEFLDRLWADWSPGWTLPREEMTALKATFAKPGVLAAALGYYRHTFNPALQVAELADLQAKLMTDPISVPALVFHGERDGCIGVETLDGMEALFPKGLKKVVLPDAGHFLHQEKPERVNEELIAFLKA